MTTPTEIDLKKNAHLYHGHELEAASITSHPKRQLAPVPGDLKPMSVKAAQKPGRFERRVTTPLSAPKEKATDDIGNKPRPNGFNVGGGVLDLTPTYNGAKKYPLVLNFKSLDGNPSTGISPTHYICAVGDVAVEVFQEGVVWCALLRHHPILLDTPIMQVWGPNPHAAVKGLASLYWAMDDTAVKWKLFDAEDKKSSLQSSLCIMGLGSKNPTPPKNSLKPFAYLPFNGRWVWQYQNGSGNVDFGHKPKAIHAEKLIAVSDKEIEASLGE